MSLDTLAVDAKWQTLPDMSVDRFVFSAVRLEHQFFVLCSEDSNRFGAKHLIECFDTTTRMWSSVAIDVDMYRAQHAFVACDSVMYAFGGLLDSHAFSDEVQDTATGAMRTPDGKWLPIPPMHQARYAFSAIVCEGKIYVMGGLESANKMLCECECFDPATQQWTVIASLSRARSYAECILIPHSARVGESVIAMVGGKVQSDHMRLTVGDVELYDPLQNRWSKATWTLPFPRIHFSVHYAHGDGVVICGGLHSGSLFQDRCNILTLSTGTWESMPSLPTSCYGAGFGSV